VATSTVGTGLQLSGGSLSNTGVTAISGTPNQISASGSTGSVTLSLPSLLALTNASSTAVSGLDYVTVGRNATTTIRGETNATSTFAGGLQALSIAMTGSATSTFAQGINITDGCIAYDGTCITPGGAGVASVTDDGNNTLTVSPNVGAVQLGLNLSNTNIWTGLQRFGNSTTTIAETITQFARTIQSTSTNALVLRTNFTSTAGLTMGSTSTPQMFALNTLNNRVTIGTGGGTPTLFVLDTKNTSGDPTGVDGAEYYNSNTGEFRCYSGSTWRTCGGLAASSTGDIQFKNTDGSFTATSNFNWSMANNGLTITASSSSQITDLFKISSSTGAQMFAISSNGVLEFATTSDPATTTGQLKVYAKEIAGRILPKWIGPSGVDTPFQAGLGFNRTSMILPAGGTTATTFVGGFGTLFTNSVTTAANPAPATTNLLTSTRRATFSTAGTANSITYHRQNTLMVTRGNASGIGGFFYTIRFGTSATQTGNRVFVGLSDSIANPTNVDPTTSATIGRLGMAINANTGNWNFVNNVAGTAPTVTPLGASFPVNTTDLYELVMFAKPNDTVINYRVKNLSTGASVSSTTLTTNIPANTTYMAPQFWMVNVAAAVATFDFGGWYLESDN
jgi:hypothetical protein